MKKTLIILVVLILFVSVAGYARMDGFKSVTPHFAGSCTPVRGEGSAEDMDVDRANGVMFISAKDRLGSALDSNAVSNGTIASYDLVAAHAQFEMSAIVGLDDFSPHGISLFTAVDGQRRLFVINHRHSGEETIEVFDINADHSLNLIKTIRHPLLLSPNDLVAVSMDQFYIANDSGASGGFEGGMEMMGLMDLSKIIYFDGDHARVVLDGFPTSGGINASTDGLTVYIGGISSKTVEVYRRDALTGDLSLLQSVVLDMAVDNIDVAADGGVWVAGHLKVIDLIRHFISKGERPAPSQVYLLPAADNGKLQQPIDMFTSLGDDLSASSVAIEFGGKFYMGGITPRHFLVCQPG
jgi:arylesterase/paraoxonase